MNLALLLATLVALLSGPLLYLLARSRLRLLAMLDGFLMVSISGLVVLEALPGTYSAGGVVSLGFLGLGLLGPTVLEHSIRRARREAHLAALALALLGLVIHSVGDGIALSTGAESADQFALPLAIALHSVPVGLMVWWLLYPVFGARPPALAIVSMCAATIAGYLYGPQLGAELGSRGWAWVQALVAGSILHVVFGRPHLEHAHSSPPVAPHFEGLGNLLALLALLALSRLHGHGHETTTPWGEAFAQAFWQCCLLAAPPVLAAYLLGGLAAWKRGFRAVVRRIGIELVDGSAVWVLLALLALTLVRVQLLPQLALPSPARVHELATIAVAALYAASLLRRGGRAWLGDLLPARLRRQGLHAHH